MPPSAEVLPSLPGSGPPVMISSRRVRMSTRDVCDGVQASSSGMVMVLSRLRFDGGMNSAPL